MLSLLIGLIVSFLSFPEPSLLFYNTFLSHKFSVHVFKRFHEFITFCHINTLSIKIPCHTDKESNMTSLCKIISKGNDDIVQEAIVQDYPGDMFVGTVIKLFLLLNMLILSDFMYHSFEVDSPHEQDILSKHSAIFTLSFL